MELREFLSVMWRGILWIILGLVAGLAIGFAVTKIQTPAYEATTKVLVSRTRQQSSNDMLPMTDQQLAATYLELLKTQPVLDDASSQVGFTVDEHNIQSTLILNTQIIKITATDKNPEAAAAIANALVKTLIQQNDAIQSGRYTVYEDALNTQVDEVQKQITSLQTQINQVNNTSIQEQLAQVNQEISQINSEISRLEQDIGNFPSVSYLTPTERASLAEKQAQVGQLESLLNLYQQIQTNLTFIGRPAQNGTARDDPQLASLQSTLNLYQQLYLSLLNNLEAVQLAQLQNAPTVAQIEPAVPPKEPARPILLLNLAIGGGAGILFSIFGLLLFEHFDTALKSSSQIEESLGLPVLETVTDAYRIEDGMITSISPHSEAAERYYSAGIGLETINEGKPIRTLMVSSCSAQAECKTKVAANLAVVYAQQGKKVILVDADIRHPSLHKILGLDNREGTLGILDENTGTKIVSRTLENIEGLTVIASGGLTDESAKWMTAEKISQLLSKLQKQADLLILDGPSAEMADVLLFAAKADALLFVVEMHKTQIASVQSALKRFRSAGVKLSGGISYQDKRRSMFANARFRILSIFRGKKGKTTIHRKSLSTPV